jgi:hypothetical protein
MRTPLVVIGTLVLASAALAQTPAPAPAPAPKPADSKPAAAPAAPPPATPAPTPPKPAPELEQNMKYFDGNWRCEGKAPAGPMGPEHAYKSTFKMKKDLDGFFYAAEYEQKKSKDNPTPVHAKGFITWESASKKLLFLGIDNAGGSVTETSPGWEGDKLVAAGEGMAMGQKIGFRETYTKKTEKEMTSQVEFKLGKDWMVIGTDTCKR